MSTDKAGEPLEGRHGSSLRFFALWGDRHSFDKRTGKVIYHCAAKYRGRTNGKLEFKFDPKRCPFGQPCDSSKMGPIIHVSVDDDPRLSAQLPRNSARFQEKYDKRGASERFFSFVKEARGLGQTRIRRRHRIVMQLLCSSLEMHARAWVRKRFGEWRPGSVSELLGAVRSLQQDFEQEETFEQAA